MIVYVSFHMKYINNKANNHFLIYTNRYNEPEPEYDDPPEIILAENSENNHDYNVRRRLVKTNEQICQQYYSNMQ